MTTITNNLTNSTSSSTIIWPRHEVFQVINPSISSSGRNLTNSLIIEASRHLAKLQSLDNSLRYIYLLILLLILNYSYFKLVLNNGIQLQVIF